LAVVSLTYGQLLPVSGGKERESGHYPYCSTLRLVDLGRSLPTCTLPHAIDNWLAEECILLPWG